MVEENSHENPHVLNLRSKLSCVESRNYIYHH